MKHCNGKHFSNNYTTIYIIFNNHSKQYRTVLPEEGLKIILQSEEALPPLILPEVLEPISKRCEKPTSTLYDTKKGICARCWNNCSLLNPASRIMPGYLYFAKEEKRQSLTLVFTCTRHSGSDMLTNEEETFKNLEMSFRESQRFKIS